MYRVTVHRHRGLGDDLGEGRVGVDGHPDLLRCPLDELGEDALRYEVSHLGADGVHPEDQVCLGVGDDLEEAVRLALDERLADGEEGELGLLDLVALLLGLGPGEPERGDLGPGEGDARDQVLVHGHGVLARHVLDGDDALVPGGVREPVATDHVPRRVDAVLGRTPELVNLDVAPVVDLDTRSFEVQPVGHGFAADGYEESLGLEGLATPGLAGRRVLPTVGAALALGLLLLTGLGARDLDPHAVVGLLQALGVRLGAREDPYAAVVELLVEGRGDLGVLEGHDAVEELDEGHLGAEVVVHAGELDADRTGPQDNDGLGIALVVRRDVVARDDLLAVELEPREGADRAPRGDQDVVGLELVRLTVVALDLYLLGLDEGARAVEDLYLVLLHEALDASAQLVDD